MNAALRRIAPLALLVLAGWIGVQLLGSFGSERIGRELAANAKPGDIMMLSSDTCEYCKQARAWLKAHQVQFGECSIERDAACKATYDALQAPGTPTLVVRGERQVGFSAERVAQALRRG
ncbi:MAG TPA: glutaredoxin family protein [Albitalea sp.]|nr:glutaredoxin family protein [Albitalea sp.]